MIFYTKIRRRLSLFITFTITSWIVYHNFNNRYSLRSYDHIKREDILENLLVGRSGGNYSESLVECEYEAVLRDEGSASLSWADDDLPPRHGVRLGGEYAPANCKPKFSSAIIVPYRDRAEQLRQFLIFMHTFLRRQQLHYRIFIVEQVDTLPFNRGTLLNIGSIAANKAGYPCLILHDVDLLPLQMANIYACTKHPRHMSCSINKHRYALKYLSLFGGAVAISSRQYLCINGMSNSYFGWGADQDEDLYYRLETHELSICRFEPKTSQYHMVYHKQSPEHTNNHGFLESAKTRMKDDDGLSSLRYSEIETVLHPLFTHIMVDLAKQYGH